MEKNSAAADKRFQVVVEFLRRPRLNFRSQGALAARPLHERSGYDLTDILLRGRADATTTGARRRGKPTPPLTIWGMVVRALSDIASLPAQRSDPQIAAGDQPDLRNFFRFSVFRLPLQRRIVRPQWPWDFSAADWPQCADQRIRPAISRRSVGESAGSADSDTPASGFQPIRLRLADVTRRAP